MKHSVISRAVVFSLVCGSASAFSTISRRSSHHAVAPSLSRSTRLFSADDNDFASLLPETSFGADVVPEGQRPVNEYLDLVRAPLFGWASEEVGTKGLLTRLVTVYAVVFATVCYPISGATFTQDGFLLQKLAASNVGAITLILFLLLRLYSGWGYVGDRLKNKAVEYEETGWYDGDVEYKSDAEKQRDLFLYSSNVKPVEDRLKLISAASCVFWIMSCVGLNVAVSAKPMFNQYDPDMLERLRYDDKLAGVAAEQSLSRPSYCDSRYYRAVANGGQGCGEN
mmetsp:Transcript_31611/g.52171  ORF Transcript_31611/g.52171 Transcript_31611/m.52171 type:complete len:282 (+) Transcript_31611:88-933(+)